ncbi:MAG: S9 family peptidase [Vicinamibacterales bacterium]
MKRLRIHALAAVVLPLVCTVLLSGTEKRTMTEKDLFSFVWIADPQISPDGSQVAFVRVSADEKADQYDTAIWIVKSDAGEPARRLTGGTRDHTPRWSPDGTRLAFVRAAEKDGKVQPPQIHLMAMAGGEARAVTDIPRGAGNPAWAPDGRALAFSGTARLDELEPKPADKDAKAEKPRQSDVRVITSAVYRANGIPGSGFVDSDRPAHIWTVDLSGWPAAPMITPKQVTSGEFSEGNAQWSRDGSRILFVADRRKDPYYLAGDSDLYAVGRDGGTPSVVASIDGGIGAFAQSPDGKRVAFIGTLNGNPERSYSQSDLWVTDMGGRPRNLTEKYDFDLGGSVGGDQRAPRGGQPASPLWTPDAESLIVRVGEQGDANIVRVNAGSGRMDPIAKGTHDVMSYTSDAAVKSIAFVRSTATVLGDLHVVSAAGGTSKKLTSFNDELFNNLTMNEPEEIWYPSFDGKKIQGWILKPPSFDPSKKYPLILQIHGGPHSAYGNTFTHEFQWMAAKGYVVLYTNPRGSSNYGQDFGNVIQFAYPGDDYKDLMAGVDEVVKKGYVDTARLGVTGGSGGGLLTNWTVTQTNRFKAAVSQRDISDWANFWYTADFTLFRATWFRKPPFEDPQDFARRSPITYVQKIQTPLLFILGDEDFRTPPSAGGEDLFRALKYLKRETAMVRFPGESHELSRAGKPWHRVERLQHIVGWFEKYLAHKEGTGY